MDPGLLAPISERSGTGRHTLPDGPQALLETGDRISLGVVAEGFFSVGDAGGYEGGPATTDSLAPTADEPELDLQPPKGVVRTPEMDARRARLIPVVATVVGCFAAVLALGVMRASASQRDTSTLAAAPARVNTARSVQRVPAPPAPEAEEPAAAAAVVATAVKAPAEAPPTATPSTRSAPESARVVAMPRAPSPQPAKPRAPVAEPARAPLTALPSVVSFAARAGDPPKSASRPPTAAFSTPK
ncbi:MAG: hypothetical protein IPI67_27405 [Myxococcales bacterium]|nr:hypothetical protein [Myxococcales bacterium]